MVHRLLKILMWELLRHLVAHHWIAQPIFAGLHTGPDLEAVALLMVEIISLAQVKLQLMVTLDHWSKETSLKLHWMAQSLTCMRSMVATLSTLKIFVTTLTDFLSTRINILELEPWSTNGLKMVRFPLI